MTITCKQFEKSALATHGQRANNENVITAITWWSSWRGHKSRQARRRQEGGSACVPLKRKRKVTQDQVLEEQHETLLLKQENLKLQRRTLELEVALLEEQINAKAGGDNGFLATINLSPIVADRLFLS